MATNTFDIAGSASAGGGTTENIALTTSVDNDWAVVWGMAQSGGVTITAGTNLTLRDTSLGINERLLDSNGSLSTAGAKTLGVTLSTGGEGSSVGFAFKPFSGDSIAFGALTTTSSNPGGTSKTFTSPTVSGSNTMGAMLGRHNASSISGITWDGMAMTKGTSVTAQDGSIQEAWYISAPTAGATNIVVTFADSCSFFDAYGVFYTGVGQESNPSSSSSVSSSPSTSVSSSPSTSPSTSASSSPSSSTSSSPSTSPSSSPSPSSSVSSSTSSSPSSSASPSSSVSSSPSSSDSPSSSVSLSLSSSVSTSPSSSPSSSLSPSSSVSSSPSSSLSPSSSPSPDFSNARRDENFVSVLLAVSSADGITPVEVAANPFTGAMLISS